MSEPVFGAIDVACDIQFLLGGGHSLSCPSPLIQCGGKAEESMALGLLTHNFFQGLEFSAVTSITGAYIRCGFLGTVPKELRQGALFSPQLHPVLLFGASGGPLVTGVRPHAGPLEMGTGKGQEAAATSAPLYPEWGHIDPQLWEVPGSWRGPAG